MREREEEKERERESVARGMPSATRAPHAPVITSVGL